MKYILESQTEKCALVLKTKFNIAEDGRTNFNSHYSCCEKYKEVQRKWNAIGDLLH